jgi:hypothetical protein
MWAVRRPEPMLPKRLPLRGYDLWCGHYQAVWAFGVLSLLLIWTITSAIGEFRLSGALYIAFFAALFWTPIWLLWKRQNNVLNMEIAHTKDLAASNYSKVMSLAASEKWDIWKDEPYVSLQLRVRPGWFDFTWGELVSVYFEGADVAMNCICDPYVSKPSLASWGRRDEHLAKVKETLRVA